jgi:hypothetical protein
MRKLVLYSVVVEVYVLMMGYVARVTVAGRQVYRQTSRNKSTGRKKVREKKKERNEWG